LAILASRAASSPGGSRTLDAPYLEQEFKSRLDQADLARLANYRIYINMMIDGMPSNVFSATTLKLSEVPGRGPNPVIPTSLQA
jgi:hypothetical protein